MTMAQVDNYYRCKQCGNEWVDPNYRAAPDTCRVCKTVCQPHETSPPYKI